MPGETNQKFEIEKLKLASANENRKSEIGLLWSRSLYFWGFLAVAIVSYGGAITSEYKSFALLAASFGIICSLAWSLANRSSKYWQEFWEKKVEEAEEIVFGASYTNIAPKEEINLSNFWGPKRYSPSKIAMIISDVTTFLWIGLALVALFVRSCQNNPIVEIFVIFSTLIATGILLVWSRSGTPISMSGAFTCAKRRWFSLLGA